MELWWPDPTRTGPASRPSARHTRSSRSLEPVTTLGFALGALAQLYVAFAQLQQGNTFGYTVFGAFGFLWLGNSLGNYFYFRNEFRGAGKYPDGSGLFSIPRPP